jgi:16S rRNA (cytosine967-C5)-methyltransferase
MLGLMRLRGWPVAMAGAGDRHALAPTDAAEAAMFDRPVDADLAALPEAVALDLPDWLVPGLRDALGPDLVSLARAAQDRAPVFLRAHSSRITATEAAARLAAEGIEATPHPRVATALRLAAHPRALRRSQCFLDGEVELQDLSSQEAMADLPDPTGLRVLDLCAGAGGKALALAARGAGTAGGGLWVHDIDPARMADLPERATRAGARLQVLPPGRAAKSAPYGLVLADVPCSGSGTWRRDPEAKWRLTPARLAELTALQSRLLREAAGLVAPRGWLAYTTCSLLREENEDRIADFLAAAPEWVRVRQIRYGLDCEGDGFFLSLLQRD